MFVLDTTVVSELRQGKIQRADSTMAAWAAGVVPRDLYVTAVTILEIELGVQRMERRAAARGRVLPFDEAALPSAARACMRRPTARIGTR